MSALQRGANGALSCTDVVVKVTWRARAGRTVEADAAAYLLTAEGKVRGDSDMVFYNQAATGDGAVTFRQAGAGGAEFGAALARVPAVIDRIAVCLTLDKGASFADLDQASISVGPAPGGAPEWSFEAPVAGASEAAMVLGELYRRAGAWKFRAVGQGFNGGLGPLSRSFGMDVTDAPAPAGPPAPNSPPPIVRPAPPTPPPISLSKISLDKPRQSISLEKTPKGFGEIRVNLNWSKGQGRGKPIDLDLACLFETRGGTKGLVQALGDSLGDFDGEPWIELSGDDRTGEVAEGETLRINGAKWYELKRVLVFAFIYEGAPNWKATDGVVLIETPGQPPIEVRMTEGRNDRVMCAIAQLENVDGAIKVTRLVEYFQGHQALDRQYRFGLRWVGATKD